jgi:Cu(I)/Ag(I) efflux system membrane fusion protein
MNKRSLVTVAAGIAILALGFFAGQQWAGSGVDESMALDTGGDALRAGPFRVQVTVNPETPVIGANTVRLRLTDNQGVPVEGATVSVVAIMPAMNPMPEMRAFAEITQTGPGVYEGLFDLPMDGSWPLTVEIEKAEIGSARLSFDMATRRPGLELLSGAQQPMSQGEAFEEAPPGTITVDARRRQTIGLKLGEVTVMPMRREIRAVGRVTFDETRLSEVALRFDAWIGELAADHVGATVVQGQPLFTVYGPDLLAAQEEYLEVLRRPGSNAMIDAARRRLELWDVGTEEIAALEQRQTPLDYVPILAPRSGVVVSTSIVEGSSRSAGTTLMRIADLSEVWVEAQVYEADLAMISLGMPATVILSYLPGQRFESEIDYVYPFLDEASRTTRVRMSLDNTDGVLKPDMYAEILLAADFGERLVVPTEAVIFAGETRVVFEDLGGGRLAPRRIQTGLRNAGYIEVLEGLEAGAQIVTSGTFLIASESRLSSGLEQW